jgi:isocitrate/isopropylmalate dehydrogenase
VGGFSFSGTAQTNCENRITVAHKVGIIAGDGIGPEVIAEGLKVIRAAGVELDTTDYDLGAAR